MYNRHTYIPILVYSLELQSEVSFSVQLDELAFPPARF